MLASFGLYLSATLFLGAAFLVAAAALQRFGMPLVHELRQASAPGMGQKLRSLCRLRLARVSERRIPPAYLQRLRLEITRAGDPGRLLPEEIIGLQLAGAVCGGIVGGLAGAALGMQGSLLLVGIPLGAVYPFLWVRDAGKRRQRQIARSLPYCLDLLTLSVEAGLDFSGALAKVVEKGRPGPLRDELALVLKELRMGRSREEGLKELQRRTDLPAIRTFVAALIQADRMGSSLGKVLRLQAGQLRAERTQRAEKLAGEAPVKMLFPLIACIFPTVFLVLFGPIAFSLLFGGWGG